MLRRFRFWLPLAAVLICLFNFLGFDRDNLMFYWISIPAWLIEVDQEIYTVNRLLVYVLTIIFYFALGYAIDTLLEKMKREQEA